MTSWVVGIRVFWFLRKLIWMLFQCSTYFSELVRTNELCRMYSEACIELCKEMDVKVVDLWTAIQKREDWMNACFMWAQPPILYISTSLINSSHTFGFPFPLRLQRRCSLVRGGKQGSRGGNTQGAETSRVGA